MESLPLFKNYTLYGEYLDQLKGFYDIMNNDQYQWKIDSVGIIFYKNTTDSQWNKLTPPKFISQKDLLSELSEKKQVLIDKAQTIQVDLFLKDQKTVNKNDIDNYNSLTDKINQYEDKILQLKSLKTDVIEEKISELREQQKNIRKTLGIILITRQETYTFKGDTLDEYKVWKSEWEKTEQYKEWKKANQLYYENLAKSDELKIKLDENLNLQDIFEKFSKYEMITPPILETIDKLTLSSIPKAQLPTKVPLPTKTQLPTKVKVPSPTKVQPKIQPKVNIIKKKLEVIEPKPTTEVAKPTTEVAKPTAEVAKPTAEVAKPKIAIQCKPDAANANKPGYVCNPISGIWVGVSGIAGKKVIKDNPFEMLHFSKGTDTTLYNLSAVLLCPIVSHVNEPLKKVDTPPKQVDEPVASSIDEPLKQVDEPIQSNDYSASIDLIIQENAKTDDVKKILKSSQFEPMLKLLIDSDDKVAENYASVRTFVSQQKKLKSGVYDILMSSKGNDMTIVSILTKIFQKIGTLCKK